MTAKWDSEVPAPWACPYPPFWGFTLWDSGALSHWGEIAKRYLNGIISPAPLPHEHHLSFLRKQESIRNVIARSEATRQSQPLIPNHSPRDPPLNRLHSTHIGERGTRFPIHDSEFILSVVEGPHDKRYFCYFRFDFSILPRYCITINRAKKVG